MNHSPNRRVLVVDDMPALHDDFRKILLPAPPSPLDGLEQALFGSAPSGVAVDFELGNALQGQEALALVQAARRAGRPYAMAFVDMRMPPGWDGVETIERLWQEDPRLQVVICTAHADHSWSEVLHRLDPRDRLLVLKKPFEPIEVLQLAHTLTTKWQLTEDAALAAGMREQLRSLELMQSIADGADAAIFAKDREGRYLLSNAQACRFIGKPAADILGRDDRALFAPHRAAEIMAMDAEVMAGDHSIACDQDIDTPGGRLTFMVTIGALHDSAGRVAGTFGIARDITERKTAHEALRQSEAFSAAILDSVDAAIAVLDTQGVIRNVNRAWRDFAIDNGVEPGQPAPSTGVGTNYLAVCRASVEAAPHPEAACALEGIEGVLNGSLPSFGMAYPCHSPQQQRWFGMNVTPLAAAGGGVVVTHSNITRRMQAELAAKASQALLDKTGRIGGVGGWTYDLVTQAIEWTDETCRIHDRPPGHRPTLAEAIGHYAPEARAQAQRALERTLATGEGFDFELPFITARGREIWVHAVAEVERLGGRPVRLVGALQDITARRAMESELRRNHELVSAVLESLPCGVCAFGNDLVLQAHNTEFRRLLGLPDALFAGATTHLEDLVLFGAARGDLGTEETVEAGVQAALARARSSVDHQFERTGPGGEHLEVRVGRMAGGGMVAVYTDVSARRQAEAQARRSAQLLSASIDAVDEAFALYDPEDRLMFCNDKYRGLFGPASHLVVPGILFAALVEQAGVLGSTATDIREGDAWVAEQAAAQPSGDSACVKRLEDGRVIRSLERRLPEGHRVGFRTDITALVRATEEAQAASLAKSRFLANMSHEIRTPMNAILGMLTLLGKTGLTARQADYADRTAGAARSLLGLLNEILDFSKVEAGAMTLEPRPFSTATLLRDVAVILDANIGNKPVLLRIDVDPNLPPLLVGDAMRLQQVLVNLGGNAIKFTPAGKVLLTLTLAERVGADVVLDIAVQDQGIGIAPENQQRIFDGFSQAESSTTRRFGGTGLGLAISQRLVALMGGTLELESALGQGSRFHFRLSLPVASELGQGMAEDGSQIQPGRLRLAGLRVLVAEDNANNQQVARELLEDEGAHVQIAQDGQQAVDAVAAADPPFDVVLMDLQMPVMDGLTATRRIREGLGLVDLPIVAMTANAMASDREACRAAGMNDHVGKPFDLGHLVGVLRRQAGWHAAVAAPAADPLSTLDASVREAADAAGIDIASALQRLGGEPGFYRRNLADFVDDLEAMRASLQACATAAEARPATQLLHTLKGLAGTFGATALSGVAASEEKRLLAEPAPPEVGLAIERACAAITAADPGLRAVLRALQASQGSGLVDSTAPATHAAPALAASLAAPFCASLSAALSAALSALAVQLRNADMAATDATEDLQRQFGADIGARLQPLGDAVAALDFTLALQHCEALHGEAEGSVIDACL